LQKDPRNSQCQSLGYLPMVLADHPDGATKGVQIVYRNALETCAGIVRVTTIVLSCDQSTEYTFISLIESLLPKCQYTISANTKYACPIAAGASGKPAGGGLSGGSIFLIIFFTVSATYLLVGIVVKWRVYNATGVEMIPNTEFWVGLPGLVRDGIIFVKNKVTGAEGYSAL